MIAAMTPIASSRDQSSVSGALPSSAGARAWGDALREVAGDRVDRVLFVSTALLVGFGYSLLLPFAYTQRLSFANWGYLDARYVAFSIAFALGFAWLITLQVHAVRLLARAAREERGAGAGGPFGALAAIASVLPSLLCCSPIVPTVVGLFGLSAGARLSTSVQLQHFFATNENALLAGGLVLLLASGVWALRKLARAACLAGECCAAPIEGQQAEAHDACFDPQYPVHVAGAAGATPRRAP
jgi:hypothetical protein